MVASNKFKLLGIVLLFVLMFSSAYASINLTRANITLAINFENNVNDLTGTHTTHARGTALTYFNSGNANLLISGRGANSFITVGASNTVLNRTALGFSFFMNSSQLDQNMYLFSNYNGGSYASGEFEVRHDCGTYGCGTILVAGNAGGSDQVFFDTQLKNNTLYHIVINLNTTAASPNKFRLWVNGTQITTSSGSQSWTTAIGNIAQNFTIYSSMNGVFESNRFNGTLDAFYVARGYNFNATDIAYLAQGNQYPFSSAILNFSITAQDIWNGSAISNFSAFINNEPKINSVNGVINTTIPQNSSSLFNITIVADTDYFSRTYTNYNVSTNLNAILTQSLANFQALSVMLNQNVVYDNITIGSQVRGFNEPFNISSGLYNATFQKLGWYNQTILINVSKLTNITYNFNGVHDARVNLSVADAINGTRLSYFDINVFNSSGFVQSVQTNNNFDNATLLQGYTYTFTFQNESYFSTSANLAVASAYNNLTLQAFLKGSMNLSVINSVNLTLLTQNVTLLVFNTTTLQTYNSLTGRFSLNNLREGGTYNLQLSAIGFNDSFYTFVYGESLTLSPYVTYMFPTGDEISINVQSVTGQIITNAVVNVSTFINGTRTLIASKLTDGVGRARFNLVADQYYVLDISADGYQTQTAQIYADQESYLISLRFFEEIIFLNPLGGIIYNFTPSGYILSPNSTNFSFSVSSQFNDIEIFSFDLYDANNNLIFILSSSNASGETLSQVVDLSAYNNTILKGVFFIKRFNQTGLSNAKFWRVEQYVPIFDTGGDSFRQFAQNNMSVGVRLAIWGVIVLIMGLTLSVLGLLGYRLVIVMLLIQYVVFYFLGAGGLEIAVNSIITLIIGYNAIMKSREEFN